MFNNPFDSFHNTVAAAKEERAGLDRLLTISTPRERLLVAGIGLLVLALAAEDDPGGVTRSVGVVGVLVGPGGAAVEGGRSIEALVWVDGDVARRLEPGMRAGVEVARADGGADTLRGEIATVASVPYSGALSGVEHKAPVSVLRVHIALLEALDVAPRPGTQCRIAIEFARESPITLFGMRHR